MNRTPDDKDEVPLSADGRRRCEEILRLACQQAIRRRSRRRLGNAALAAGSIATLVIVATLMRPTAPAPSARPLVAERPPQRSQPAATGLHIERLQTDPNIVARLAVRPAPRQWRPLDDDQLLQTLASSGRHAALAHRDGHTFMAIAGADTAWAD